jgi:uncharacterized membrane protein
MTRPLLVTSGLLGVVAGLRSQLPNAALAARGLGPTSGPLAVLGSPAGRRAAYLAAAGEIVADKLPATPSRVGRGPLIGRVVSGGLAGAAVFASTGQRGRALLVPALAGAAGAFAGSWGGYLGRRQLVAATGLPDPAVAVAEDALAVGLAALAVRRTS